VGQVLGLAEAPLGVVDLVCAEGALQDGGERRTFVVDSVPLRNIQRESARPESSLTVTTVRIGRTCNPAWSYWKRQTTLAMMRSFTCVFC
jgi:hypothetical protein